MDYYQLFGVPRNASIDDIRTAFHQQAMVEHPDKHRQDGKWDEATEKMKDLSIAWEILSDTNKRTEYDKTLPPETVIETKETKNEPIENVNSAPKENNQSTRSDKAEAYKVFYQGIADEFDWHDLDTSPESITIPENDWGLLVAMVKAYSSQDYERYVVKKSSKDGRQFMPDTIYIIESFPPVVMKGKVKDKGEVVVARTLADWLDRIGIKTNFEGGYKHRNTKFSIPKESFVSSNFLKQDDIDIYGLDFEDYVRYTKDLDSLAKTIATRGLNLESLTDGSLLRRINRYGSGPLQDITDSEEGSVDTEKEIVTPVPLENFFEKLHEAEINVKHVENVRFSKEGILMLAPPKPGSEHSQ